MRNNIPKHIAIIPDGNRRWAKEKKLPTFEGHRRGFDISINLTRKAYDLGITTFTLWAFSTENWQRSPQEVSYLMKLYEIMIAVHLKEALKRKIRIIHIGRKDRINQILKNKIIDAENKTRHFNQRNLVIALDYGGKDEILRCIEKIKKSKNKKEIIEKCLDTAAIPNPDLIIRTGGEKRLSGFLLWQSEYAELIFLDKYFPDFTPKDLEICLDEYSRRQRRFGK